MAISKRHRWTSRALLLLLAAARLPAAAQPPASEAAEEARALRVVRALAAGDAAALATALQEELAPEAWGRRSPEEWGTFSRMLVERHGGLMIEGVDVYRGHRLEVETRDPQGATLVFGFDFEPQPPHRILGLGIEASMGGRERGPELPPLEVAAGAGRAALAAALSSWLNELAAAELFSGAALVATDGEPLFVGARGLASREYGVANTAETRFDVGSINKSFTRVAVARRVADGQLSLDDTIADHLDDYPDPEVAAKVTLRHLLEHSSGLGDIFTETYGKTSKAELRRPRDYFPLFAGEPLRFEPGTGREYSNAGYIVLGAILEAASGEPFDDHVRRHVFEPAGMERSGFFARDEPVPGIATGYTRHTPDGELRKNTFRLPVQGNPAGSAQSTVADLLRFDEALRQHRLVPPAWTAWVLGGPEPAAGEAGPAAAERSRAAVGYAGGGPGVSAVVESDGELTVVVLANQDPPIAETMARAMVPAVRAALR